MRPIRLAMAAFGPYVDAQVIDFAPLASRGLFLISGPIGAGKTTILDAVCYALYGESSGSERKAQAMRSQFATTSQPTEVSLDFAVGDKTYRVVRAPEQTLVKKKGTGETRRLPTAELFDRTACTDEEEVGDALAAKTDAVNAEITRLIGFRADQFRQTIMLPQGRFREFLASNTSAREDILKVLFDVRRCERLEEIVKARCAVAEAEVREREEQRRALLGDYASPEAIDAAILAARQLTAGLEEQDKAAAQVARQAHGDLEAGRRAKEAHDSLEQARIAVANLAARQAAIDGKREEVRFAEAVAPVIPCLDEADRRHQALLNQQKALSQERENARSAATAAASAAEAAAQAGDRKPEAERLRSEVAAWQPLIPKLDRLSSVIQDLVAAQESEANKRAALAARQQSLDASKAEVKQAEVQLPVVQASAVRKGELSAQVQALQQRLTTRKTLEVAQARLGKAARERDEGKGLLVNAEKDYAQAQACRDEVRAAWMSGRAGQLAAQLEPGKPCPVCGATEHPRPAEAPPGASTDAALDKAEKALKSRQTAMDESRKALADSESRVAGAREKAETLAGQLGDDAGRPVADLDAAVKALDEAVALAASAEVKAGELQACITRGRNNIAEAEEQLKALHTGLSGLQATLRSLTDQRTAIEAEVRPEFRIPGALAKAIAAQTKRARAIEEVIETSRKASEVAAGRAAETRGSLARQEGAFSESESEALASRQQASDRLAKAGFKDAASCRAAFRNPAALAVLRREIEGHVAAVSAAADRLKKATEDVGERLLPDIARLELARNSAEKAARDMTVRLTEQRKDLAALEDRLRKIRAGDEAGRSARERHAALNALGEAVAGRNPLGVRFSTFALAAYLDEVLLQASQRLRLMSGGRYTIQRAQPGGGRGFQGLDLEVFDEATGQSRAAVTLSGGESFLASLALALGLADTVQSVAGGRRLESVFIDEGFGSLDPASLDLAQRCVMDLQASGRLVGLISHVEEMKTWTTARIVVDKTPRGSTVRVEA